MKLLPNEEKLVSSNEDKIILTDHRIFMTDKSFGKSYSICIFLEDISAIEIKYKSELIFIVLAIIALLSGVYLQGENGGGYSMVTGIIIGAIFIILWASSRKHTISIASNGKPVLNVIVEGMKNDKIIEFADRVLQAKQNRAIKLYKL